MADLPNVSETDFELKPFEAARILNDIIRGRSNNTGTLTLSANSDSTTISNNLFESQMTPVLVPTTANAALESWYISARSQGSFTINHTNNGQTDRTYLYIWVG